ncbi:MAG: hypothetical protein DME74_06080 [Verrucomicrobia bacterium]|nr:MAG: hypothetical protein DME74_06080 [Verrucomicrobiota bacterium]
MAPCPLVGRRAAPIEGGGAAALPSRGAKSVAMKSQQARKANARTTFRIWQSMAATRLECGLCTRVRVSFTPLVWWAILLIVASFISWLYVLRYVPLTVAYPLSRVVDVLVPLGCWIFLGELISTFRWCGIGLVIIGLALVAKPIAQIEERL